MQNLDEKEYPRYLAKLFKLNTGENLPLKWNFKKQAWEIDKNKCKTFNQKIQWIKLYGVTDLMRECTDKIKVRDYVKEKIGEEYLKPVLQIIHSCHSENLENQNDNLVDFQVIQNLKKKSQKEEMPKQVRHDSPLGVLQPTPTNTNHYPIFKQFDVKTYKKYLPDIKYFQKYGHLCASRCGVECRYCYKCAEKIQKVYEKKMKEREKEPHYVPACTMAMT